MRNAIEIADKSNLTFFNKRQNNHDHPEKKIFQTKLINNYNLFLTINTNYQLKTLIKTTTNEEAQNSINNQNHKKQIMGREKKDDDFANEDDIEMIEEAEKITKKPTTKKKSTTNKKQKDISIEITTTPQSQTTPNTQSPQPTSTQLNMKAFKTSKEVFAAVANLGVTKRFERFKSKQKRNISPFFFNSIIHLFFFKSKIVLYHGIDYSFWQ